VVARAVDRPTPDVADWRAPWLAAIAAGGRVLSEAVDPRAALNAEAERLGVRNAAGRPLRFAGPDAAGGVAYEAHIHATGAVPTRLNRPLCGWRCRDPRRG
jgi:hypothetical protein